MTSPRFIHAPHSRERLRTTRTMLMLTFTYHQVMPSFLDFLFPFGKQQHAEDFHFGGFRHENRLAEIDRGLSVPEIGRSGRDFRLCYSLKSAEQSKGQQHWPWSIRQTSIYHSFDVETSRATWIVIKGARTMKDRIMSASRSDTQTGMTSFETSDSAFASTLVTHSMFCDWSGENWRWYINYLEEVLQNTSRRILVVPVDHLPSPTFGPPSRKLTGQSVLSDKTGVSSGSTTFGTKFQDFGIPLSPMPLSPPPSFVSRLTGPHEQPEPSPQQDHQQDLVFSDLQRIQFIKEKADETLLVLKVNVSVLSELRHHYQSIIESESCPDRLRTQCQKDVARFKMRVTSVENDMRMQQWRLETLLSLIADRQALVCCSNWSLNPNMLTQYSSMASCNIETQKRMMS